LKIFSKKIKISPKKFPLYFYFSHFVKISNKTLLRIIYTINYIYNIASFLQLPRAQHEAPWFGLGDLGMTKQTKSVHPYSSQAFQRYQERGMKHGGLGDLSMRTQIKLLHPYSSRAFQRYQECSMKHRGLGDLNMTK
jgi:hypothetical protein